MDENALQWVKIISFSAAMSFSFMIGRAVERSRMIRFFTERGEEIEKILDEFFTPEDPSRMGLGKQKHPHQAVSGLGGITKEEFGQKNRYLA